MLRRAARKRERHFFPQPKKTFFSLFSLFYSLETETGKGGEEEEEELDRGSSPAPPSTASFRIAAGESEVVVEEEAEEEAEGFEEEAERLEEHPTMTEARANTDLTPAAALFFPARLSAIPSATIQLRAQMETMGLTPLAVGNRLASATKRLRTSQLSPVAPSTTPVFGDLPALAVPIW